MKSKSVQKKGKTLKYLLVTISLFIIILWSSLYFLQNHNIKTVYKTIEMNGRLYLEMLNDIIQSNLYSQDVIESLFFERAEMLIHYVMEEHSPHMVDSLRISMRIHHVCTIDSRGNLIRSIPENCADMISVDHLPRTYDFVLLEVEEDPSSLYFVTYRENKWFVASIYKRDYMSLLKPIQLSTLFTKLGEQIERVSESVNILPQIRYLIIQDKRGIIAATENITRMQRITSDEFLASNLRDETIASRSYDFEENEVLEIVRPFYLGEEPVLLRLGISLEKIEALESNRNLLFVVYSMIFIGILALEFLFYRNHIKINRMTESLQKAEYMAGIGELGREVAHEIKNPLNAISMTLQRLNNEIEMSKNDLSKKMLARSFSEIERLNKIVERFLDYSRPLELKIENVAVYEFINKILNLFSEELKNKKINTSLDGSLDLIWDFDPEAITQVLINVIKNCIESFEDENVNSRIQIKFNKKNDELQIKITDNGVGIHSDDMHKIWDLYFSTKENGNGLGLSISAKTIKAHQGRINIISTINKGTEVNIILPKVEIK